MYACFSLPNFQTTLQTRGLVSSWLGEGVELQTNPTTLHSECPVGVCVLQSEPAACPSSAGSKGTERREQVCARMPSREPCGEERHSMKAWSSCVEPRGFCELTPKPCAKLIPVPTMHILQQGLGLSAPSLQVGTGSWGSCPL